MIPALDSCIGPMSVVTLFHSPLHLYTSSVLSLALKCYPLYFRFQTVISHRPSYHMYFVIYCFVFLWSYYFFWLQIDFIATVWLTKCVCHQDHVLSVINTEWVSFLWLCGLYNKIVLIAGNELSWFKIRINCLTQYFYELLLLCTLKYKNAQSMS